MQLSVDRFGRMVLPKRIRDEWGLKPGDQLEATETGGRLVLCPSGRADGLRRKGKMLVFGGRAAGDLEQVLEQDRHDRISRAAAWTKKR
jgi:AbrB family looped-hinge helix DNA binding protein